MRSFSRAFAPAALVALALTTPAQAKGSDTERILVNKTAGPITLRPDVAALPRQVVGVTLFKAGSAVGLLHELDPQAGPLPDLHLGIGDRASFVLLKASLTGSFVINFQVITDTTQANSIHNGTLIYAFNPSKHEDPRIKLSVHFREPIDFQNLPNVQATPPRSDARGTVIELTSLKPAECCVVL